ncbi:MAG: hypothetical protein SOW25_04695 [Helicobacter sp.]|nr:hypothetical protein [Helicobacteraceae bacterium]MDY3113610.1 hypothetical protein [Helicobacter sp.]
MHYLFKKNISAYFVLLFFIALCVFSVAMAVILSNKSLENNKDFFKIPRFEVSNFTYYRLTKSGISAIASGEVARENTNGEYELKNLKILANSLSNATNLKMDSKEIDDSSALNPLSKKAMQESIEAPFALYNNASVLFTQGVTYKRDSMKFWSESAEYFPQDRALQGSGAFVIFDAESKIRGQNISYRDGKIYAQNIQGILRN